MEKFSQIDGLAAPLMRANIDTDIITPGKRIATTERDKMGEIAFEPLRFNPDGSENPDFVLNKPSYRKAKILVAGDNFGCGSSREHAPWALADFGIRCVISTSFGDIFYNNCFKNGILPIALPQADVDKLMSDAKQGNGTVLTINLEAQTITRPNGEMISFDVDPFRKNCLIEGLDDIGLTLKKSKKIDAFEAERNQLAWC